LEKRTAIQPGDDRLVDKHPNRHCTTHDQATCHRTATTLFWSSTIPRFLPAAAGVIPASTFLTQDEESSGIIDASDVLGNGWYLLDVQAHLKSADPELVEGGQLLAMYIPTPKGGSTNPYPRGSIYR